MALGQRILALFMMMIFFSAATCAGEVIIKLPKISDEAVVSLHPKQAQTGQPHAISSHILHQKGRMFEPHFMVIPVGSTVDMTNDDNVYHNIFSFSPTKPFDLGLYPHGDHKAVTFDKEGEVKIFCAVHPQMHATILVLNTPWFEHSKGKSELRMRKIPSGQYEARLWQENREILILDNIEVSKSGTARIDFNHTTEGNRP